MDTVSVIVPVYNTPETLLKQALDSLVGQSYKDLQIILVDDGSSNNAGCICDEYAASDKRVTALHRPNRGVSTARNTGLASASGAYLTFMDSDDELNPEAIERAVSAIKTHDAQCVVWSWNEHGDERGEKKTVRIIAECEELKSAEDTAAAIAADNIECGGGYVWNKLWNVEAIRQSGGDIPFFDVELFAYEDKVWDIKLLGCCSKVVLLPDILYEYKYVPTSLTKSDDRLTERVLNDLCGYRAVIDAAAYSPVVTKNATVFYNSMKISLMVYFWKRRAIDNASYLRMRKEYSEKKELLRMKHLPSRRLKLRYLFFKLYFLIF